MSSAIYRQPLQLLCFALAAVLLQGCKPPEPMDPTVGDTVEVEKDPVATAEASSTTAKPGAPVQLDYQVMGTPAVGEATEVQLTISSSKADAPVSASYRIPDASALSFVQVPADGAPVEMVKSNSGAEGNVRLEVIPHREGRHWLNVLMEVETEMGPLSKSLSVPIEVPGTGGAPQEKQSPERVDGKGAEVVPMSARESRPGGGPDSE